MQAKHEFVDVTKFSKFSRPTVTARRSQSDNLTSKTINHKIQKNSASKHPAAQSNSKTVIDFKFVTESELEAALKRVRRAKQKKEDEEEWQCFLKLKKEESVSLTAKNSVCSICSAREVTSCSECGLPAQDTSGLEVKKEDPTSKKEDSPVKELSSDDNDHDCLNVEDADGALLGTHVYQLGPGLTRRLQDLLSTVKKMTEMLLNPNLMSQFEDEDVERVIKRSIEFDAMFARNHLYEIQRLLKDSKQAAKTKSKNILDLEVKVSAALKSITQALQVYARHVSKGSRVKYQQVVPIFQSIVSTLELLEQLTGQRLFPLRKEIEVSCSYMKQVLLEISATETKTISTVSYHSKRVRSKHKPSADLSMYNRKKLDWRRKSAALARVKFGVPSASRFHRKSASTKNSTDKNVDKKDMFEGNCTDTQGQLKENNNAKEVPFRNATRAIPEEHVTTMMEMIPHEPSDKTEICIDANTFETLKLLNGGAQPFVPLRQDSSLMSQLEAGPNPAFSLRRKPSLFEFHSAPPSPVSANTSLSNTALDSSSQTCVQKPAERVRRPASAKSSKEASNVRLVFLSESEATSFSTKLCQEEIAKNSEENFTTLSIDEISKNEALEFQKKMLEYQKSSTHYKDNKAVGIVDRLASNILSEMILDFQKDEMDQVICTLFNLEFE